MNELLTGARFPIRALQVGFAASLAVIALGILGMGSASTALADSVGATSGATPVEQEVAPDSQGLASVEEIPDWARGKPIHFDPLPTGEPVGVEKGRPEVSHG